LAKPFGSSDLLRVLQRALDRVLLDAKGRTIVRAADPPPVETTPAAGHLALRVLLAEDNPINRRVSVLLLEKQGCSVVVVENGKQVIEAWREQDFDLILLDVQMPIMDGFETTAQLRQIETRTGRRIPIVALTAHAMRGDEERCLEAGMDGYVSKPVRPQELYAALERATRSVSAA
jgi:CheY-like chemotaxis protein